MANKISNEAFEAALKNKDNDLIMKKACSSFRNVIEHEELHRCKLIALWEAMIHWNPSGRKFTSFLYQKVNWECLKVIQKQKKHKFFQTVVEKSFDLTNNMEEIIESLPPELKDILIKRFVYQMTLREIAQTYGACHETIRRKIYKAIKILRNNHQKDKSGV